MAKVIVAIVAGNRYRREPRLFRDRKTLIGSNILNIEI